MQLTKQMHTSLMKPSMNNRTDEGGGGCTADTTQQWPCTLKASYILPYSQFHQFVVMVRNRHFSKNFAISRNLFQFILVIRLDQYC